MITIYSPGKLYGDLTIEELKGEHYRSSLRNKLIAESFYLIGEIEKYGTGFLRIRKALKSYPEISFSFEEVNNGILVTYMKKTAQKTTQKDTKKQILNLLNENPYYTREDLVEKIGKADGTIKEHLANLKDAGLIERIGGRKEGYWKVK